jgi:hypothetical protein
MKRSWVGGLVLCAGVALGGIAQAQAPAGAAQKAAADKAAQEKAAKAKEAEIQAKYEDRAVANYKKNKAAKK